MHSSTFISLLLASAVSITFADAKMAHIRRTGPGKHRQDMKRDDTDYSDLSHCPGGSIGDADRCTFEATTIYDTTLKRWTQYGAWYDNCNPVDTAALVETVSSSVAVGNSFTETTEVSIGLEDEGLSIGVSQSFAESWSTTTTATQSQGLTVGAGQSGNISLANQFYVAEGYVKINYGSRQDGHYIWLSDTYEIFTLDSGAGDTYSANVANCSDISQPTPGVYYYEIADYNNVKAGSSSTYTYPDNS